MAIRDIRFPRFRRPPVQMIVETSADDTETILLWEGDRVLGRAVVRYVPGGTVESLEAELAALDQALASARRLRREARKQDDGAEVKRLDRIIVGGDHGRANGRKTLQYLRGLYRHHRVFPTSAEEIAKDRVYRDREAQPEARRRRKAPVMVECDGPLCTVMFRPNRKDGRFHSDACRQSAYRLRRKG